MPSFTAFFLNSSAAVVRLECLSITHPNFTRAYHLTRSNTQGFTATLEDLVTAQAFEYMPMAIGLAGQGDNLDQALTVTLGDVGDTLPLELDAVMTAGGMGTFPACVYRCWRSDDLTAPMLGPVPFQIESVSFSRDGMQFEALAHNLNRSRTGETYSLTRFPELRGVL